MAGNSENTQKISLKDSIKTKLIVIMVLVTAIPLIVAIVVSYITSTNKALKDAQDSQEWQAWYIEDRFASIINTNMTIIKTLAVNPTILNFVKGEGGIPYDAVQNTLAGCDEVLGDGENTSITDTTGMQIARGKGNFVSVAERPSTPSAQFVTFMAPHTSPVMITAISISGILTEAFPNNLKYNVEPWLNR